MIYSLFLEELHSVCKEKGLRPRVIGFAGKDKELPIYKIVIPAVGRPRKTVLFAAGMHGNETAGSWAVISFLKRYSPDKYNNLRIVILPVANPYGFDNNKRRNSFGKDLNRHFCDPRLTEDNKILYNSIADENIHFFHSMHEDPDERNFYAYGYEKNTEKIYRDIVKFGGRFFPINNKKKIYGDVADKGLILNIKDGSLEQRLTNDGVPYVICTETPGKQPFSERVEANARMMKKVIQFCNKKSR